MANKIKKTQFEQIEEPQGRDLFQTPNYAIDILVPFLKTKKIWESAAGLGKISNRLGSLGFDVLSTDINNEWEYFNFLLQTKENVSNMTIVTNPPYSLKRKFYNKCKEYNIPFALLIPADYSGWIIDALRFDKCEKLIPTRRIDFITPSGKSGLTGNTSNYHSLWLTWGLGLGKSETFVELTNDMKRNI